MAPHLRILAGPHPGDMQDITSTVNSGKSHTISSGLFEGEIALFIQDFPSAEQKPSEGDAATKYFSSPERKGVTWSLQSRGRFLQSHDLDSILFGNTFDKSLNLPWGSGAALKLMSYVDPTLEQDLGSQTRPWALSPFIATMPHLSVHNDQSPKTAFPSVNPLDEKDSILKGEKGPLHTANDRKAHFRTEQARKAYGIGPEDTITADFCYGYLSFHPALALKLPGGVTIDLQRHWDGQQVRFVCCERGPGPHGEAWGRIFWCIAIEPADSTEAVADPGKEIQHEISKDID